MAIILLKGGDQLPQMQHVTYLNALDSGILASEVEAVNLKAAGLPEFRDAVRALIVTLTADGWTFTTAGPDDGDSIERTRDKINALWAGSTAP